MAIAFDAATDLGRSIDTNAVITTAHTCTGSDRFLIVSVLLQCNVGGSSSQDFVTSVTYNGVAMTRAVVSGSSNTYHCQAYIYYLINPASGSNNVVVTTTKPASPDEVFAHAVSYTGVKQSGQPDAFNSSDSSTQGSPVTQTVTTVANNCWLFGTYVGDGNPAASTGTTSRVVHTGGVYSRTGDSNGAKTPAGSHSLVWTVTGSTPTATAIISFAPSTGTTLNLSENLSTSIIELLTRAWTAPRSRSEVITLQGESTSRTWNAPRSPSDVITITETFSGFKGRIIEILENLGVTETFGRVVAYSRGLSESVTISEIFSKLRTAVVDILETLVIVESVVVAKVLAILLTDVSVIIEYVRTPLNWLKRTKPTTTWTPRTKP